MDRCAFYSGGVGPGQGNWYCFHSPYVGCSNTMPVNPPVTSPCEEDFQCDDHNPCTEEYCNASGVCYSGLLVDGRTCSDGRAIQGVCAAGLCHF